ncbi:MAG: glycoside hydrolase N-terminal domain-containing protein [Oscillospiraceae bacterium]|nr:glycoside hydrolase N-terminal domain-containing protein [Oscillospiraceae bacterium]
MFKKIVSVVSAAAVLAGSFTISLSASGSTADSTAALNSTDDYAPMRTYYDKPATEMTDFAPEGSNAYREGNSWQSNSLPIGNGRLGGMVFGGTEVDRIQTNEITLWSGGPGKNQNYSEDIYRLNMPEANRRDPDVTSWPRVRTSEQARSALAQLQRILQDNAIEFTNRAKPNPQNPGNYNGIGNANPADGPITEAAKMVQMLVGNKIDFGSYQSMGDIYIRETEGINPIIVAATSNGEHPSNANERALSLFDGGNNTKWFAGGGGVSAAWPVTVWWNYDKPITFSSYTLTTANDRWIRDPSSWKLYGSNDDAAGAETLAVDPKANSIAEQLDKWTLIHTVDDYRFVEAPFPTDPMAAVNRRQDYTFELDESATYKYYRLQITETVSGTSDWSGGQEQPQLTRILFHGDPDDIVEAQNYRRGVDLDKGQVYESYEMDGVKFTKDYFVSHPDNVMAVRISAAGGKLTREFTLSVPSGNNPHQVTYESSAQDGTITMTGRVSDHQASYAEDKRLNFVQQIKIIPVGGTMTATANNKIEVRDADQIVMLMTAATNYQQSHDDQYIYFKPGYMVSDLKADVVAVMNAAAAKGYDQLYERHFSDYNELFSRVKLELCGSDFPENKTTDQLLKGYKFGNNTEQENRYLEVVYYQYGRYLLIGSSRDSLPANLQGIWADGYSPPWASDYHTNINVQMNYWLAQQTNLAELHQPMIEYTKSLVPRGTETAKYFHQKQDGSDVRGWTTYHENNIWGYCVPAISGAFYAPTAAAWLAQDLWEQYAFTMDKSLLESNYDTMLQAALFWVDFLWEDERDGYLVANPSYSPEHGPLTPGASSEQLIIWQNFEQVIEAAKILGKENDPEILEIKDSQSRLWLPRIGLNGQYMEWKDETIEDIQGGNGHRHVNHLMAVHPGNLVVAGRSDYDNQYIESMKTVLNVRGDGGTGWSMAWKINFWARIRDGNRAGVMVSQILRESTYNNLFDAHPPFQIDGNFGATGGMTEMLLQSQGMSVDFLPSLPSMWHSGRIEGLKARGNFEVGMEWSDRVLDKATVKSIVGSDLVLYYPHLATATVTDSKGNNVAFAVLDNNNNVILNPGSGELYNKISFPTTEGETYTIITNDKDIDLQIDLRQNKLSDKPEASYNLLGTNFKNLHSEDVLIRTNAPADIIDDGVFVEYFDHRSAMYHAGLRMNDVITKINGYLVTDVAQFEGLWNIFEDDDNIILKVWRQNKYIDVTFNKDDILTYSTTSGFVVPGTFKAVNSSERISRYEGTTARPSNNGCDDLGRGQNIGNTAGGDWLKYSDVDFTVSPVSVTLRTAHEHANVSNLGIYAVPAGTAFNIASALVATTAPGNIAVVPCASTGGWQIYRNFTVPLAQTIEPGKYDIYIKLGGTTNLNFFSFEGASSTEYDGPEMPGILEEYPYGDVDMNTAVDVRDILAQRDHILGTDRLSGINLEAADVNEDGVVNIFDMLTTRQIITSDRKPKIRFDDNVEPDILDYDSVLAWMNRGLLRYDDQHLADSRYNDYRDGYLEAMADAQSIFTLDGVPTQSQIFKAGEALKEYILLMEPLYIRKSIEDYQNYIKPYLTRAESKGLVETEHTSASWKRYDDAFNGLQALVVGSSADTDINDLNAAVSLFVNASNKLVKKGDISELSALVDSLKDKTSAGYSSASWLIFDRTIKAAQSAINTPNGDIDQIIIDDTYRDLFVADKALKPVV